MFGSVLDIQKGMWNCVAVRSSVYVVTFDPNAARTRRERKMREIDERIDSTERTAGSFLHC